MEWIDIALGFARDNGVIAGSVVASISGAYKITVATIDRVHKIRVLEEERDCRISEMVKSQYEQLRSDVFAACCDLVDSIEETGAKYIEFRVKSIPTSMHNSTMLEKTDRHLKDACKGMPFVKWFCKAFKEENFYNMPRSEFVEQSEEQAIAFHQSMQTRLTKDVGHSKHFIEAYKKGFSLEQSIAMCNKIFEYMVKQHHHYEYLISQERKLFKRRKRNENRQSSPRRKHSTSNTTKAEVQPAKRENTVDKRKDAAK